MRACVRVGARYHKIEQIKRTHTLRLNVVAQLEPLPDDIVDSHLIKSVKLQGRAPDNTH